MGHSCRALLWDTLVGRSCRKLLWDTRVGHSCRTLLWDTLLDELFVRDFLQKSRVKSQKRAFRTRLPPKVTRQVSKTSVSYETSSKSHMSSPQNERSVRDLLKNSHVKVCKTNVSHETSSKSPAETPIGAHTSRSPAKQFRDSSPPNDTRSHANPNATATFTSTATHNLPIPCACHESFRVYTSNAHKVLRLPRNVTSVTPRNLTIPCACHENRTSTPQKSRTKYCACHEK